MFEKLAIFDIGSYAIKCIKAKTGIKNFNIESLIVEDLDLRIENKKSEQIQLTIEKILSQNNLEDYSIITMLPSNRLFFYTLTFPFINIKQIAEVMRYEIADSIPLEIESTVFDFQPIRASKTQGTEVIAAVAEKFLVSQLLEIFSKFNCGVAFIGTEFNALYHSYVYFNTVQDESIIQLNIGYEKTIVNLIINNQLIATRTILFGVKNIEQHFNKVIPENNDIYHILSDITFDIASLDNNLHYKLHKHLNISQQKFKSLFTHIQDEIDTLLLEIVLFINIESQKHENLTLQRIIISGGGSLLTGLSTVISQNLQIPVVMQTLVSSNETEIPSQFCIAFGLLLNYLQQNRYKTINFLVHEFESNIAKKSRKSFYIAFFYAGLSILFLIVFIMISVWYQLSMSQYYHKILDKRYKQYFLTSVVPNDPIKDATNRYTSIKREVDSIESFLKTDNKMIEILYLLLSNFPYDANFDLNNMVINESVIRIDGTIKSTAKIDEFKNKLVQTKKFDSVVLNTNVMQQNNVKFSMTIKFKSTKQKTRAQNIEE